ncbi:monofunctional biosynthetic peptidoglycan transglycosylase [Cyclobacterium sp. GBPx2]|uniref:Biosynthetic peptidoglycan transglycosylase n=1 Tax=Cyclobacterium plantarum TaxID=2716263 RepID=A0ABX0H8Q3_9BACT|nr:monofunctional biosynthetic peptidoglycan transglycosylase [Cyclobacterium plantarum]
MPWALQDIAFIYTFQYLFDEIYWCGLKFWISHIRNFANSTWKNKITNSVVFVKKQVKKIFHWVFYFLFGLCLFSILTVIFYASIPVLFTPLMGLRAIEQGFDENRDFRLKKDWVNLDEVSPHLYRAVIAAEDQKFLEHQGFDWEAIEKAFEGNRAGKRIKGGSTISNQTAKNVFLWPQRNWLRKGLEAYFTFLIEFFWSKERIMEVYLNVIEMGDGIYGAEAAAQFYFGKAAADLSRQEAALIAAVLPNPLRWRPDQPTIYIRERQKWILRNMNNLGELEISEKN